MYGKDMYNHDGQLSPKLKAMLSDQEKVTCCKNCKHVIRMKKRKRKGVCSNKESHFYRVIISIGSHKCDKLNR